MFHLLYATLYSFYLLPRNISSNYCVIVGHFVKMLSTLATVVYSRTGYLA